MNCLFPFFCFFNEKKKTVLLSIPFLLLFSFQLSALNNLQVNSKFQNDTAIIHKQLRNFKTLVFENPDSVLKFIVQIENSTSDKLIRAHCSRYRGLITILSGKNEEALTHCFEALDFFKKIGEENQVNMLNLNIGVAYLRMGYYNLANDYLYKARIYFDNSNDINSRSKIYLNLTFLFEMLKQDDKARELAYQSLETAKLANDSGILSLAFYNLAELVHLKQKDYVSAIEVYKKAEDVAKAANTPRSVAYAQRGLGEAYFLAGKIDSAKYYLNLVLKSPSSDIITKIFAHGNYANIFSAKSEYTLALNHSYNALLLSKQIGMKPQVIVAYMRLANIYKELNNYKKALAYRDSSAILSDSLFEERQVKQAMELEEIYQNKKKQEEIDNLAVENKIQKIENQKTENLVLALILVLIVLFLATILIYRFNKLKATHKQSETEQKLLRSQMNPHFIFNAISSIQNFVQKNKPNEASLYLANFAKLMRHILLNSRKEFITLDDEIDTLENYLKLQQLRLDNIFSYEISVSDKIDKEELGIPPMVLQPFVENTIKHGLTKKLDGNGRVQIEFNIIQEKLNIKITDNGIGRNEANQIKKSGHQSLATTITRERLRHLKKKYRKKSEIEIVDLKENNKPSGTQVIIKLPVKYI